MSGVDQQNVTDPGKTPGQAEGVDEGQDQSSTTSAPPNRTQDQAEGDSKTVEESTRDQKGLQVSKLLK